MNTELPADLASSSSSTGRYLYSILSILWEGSKLNTLTVYTLDSLYASIYPRNSVAPPPPSTIDRWVPYLFRTKLIFIFQSGCVCVCAYFELLL